MPAKGKTKGHTMEKSTTQNPQAGGHSSDKFVGGASSHPNVVDNVTTPTMFPDLYESDASSVATDLPSV